MNMRGDKQAVALRTAAIAQPASAQLIQLSLLCSIVQQVWKAGVCKTVAAGRTEPMAA